MTRAIYEKVRKKFISRNKNKPIPNRGIIPTILDFLQDGADKNISLSTLKVQVAALSSIMDTRLAEDPLIKRFLMSLKKARLAKMNRTLPTLDMYTVLRGFLSPPFEPMEDGIDKKTHSKNCTSCGPSIGQKSERNPSPVYNGTMLLNTFRQNNSLARPGLSTQGLYNIP